MCITHTTSVTHIIYIILITCITHIIYIIYITCITHNLFFKVYKKKFSYFFLYIKMTTNYQKHKEKLQKKKHAKDIKIFLKKKKTKGKKKKKLERDIKILVKK